MFPTGEHFVDGEGYEHRYRTNFEKIVSLIRQETPTKSHEVVQFHVFDYFQPSQEKEEFNTRLNQFNDTLCELEEECPSIVSVRQHLAKNQEEMEELYSQFMAEGYEGAMVKNLDSPYEFKRSYNLLKVKEFLDDEFDIIGVDEGRGKLMGHAAAFVCRTKLGSTFKAKMKGETSKLKEYFDNSSLWEGKRITVRYQNLTSDGIPRFPIALSIREE
jgi:DNA ligase-1